MTKKKHTFSREGLVRCSGCQSFIQAQDEACPFCEASPALHEPSAPYLDGAKRRMSKRSKALAVSLLGLTALGGVALGSCGDNTNKGQEKQVTQDGGTQPDTRSQPDARSQPEPRPDRPLITPYGIPPDEE